MDGTPADFAGDGAGLARPDRPYHHLGAAKKNALKPWQVKTWCIGTPSAGYVAKMEDVLDVHQRPYNPRRPVVDFDEGGKELRDTPQGTLPMQPGQPEKEDYEYE